MPSFVRDGVSLAFDHAEGTGRPIVLIHGWCCDRTYFREQFAHFREAGRTVLALDLRGHGESDKPEGAYTMPALADDVAGLTHHLGIEAPVVIGHSMGGVVAFDLAARYPDLAGGIVMIDSPVVRAAASRANMPAFLEKLRGDAYQDAVAGYVTNALFLPTDNAARKIDILAKMRGTPRHVMIAAFEGMRDFDPESAAGRVKVPCLYIAADDKPLSDMPRFFRLMPDLLFGQTVGSGHFCQLEVPEQVNAMLDRFLGLIAPR